MKKVTQISRPSSGWFLTAWEVDREVVQHGKIRLIWRCLDKSGYAAYEITDGLEPRGSGHFTSLAALFKITGVVPQGRIQEIQSFGDEVAFRNIQSEATYFQRTKFSEQKFPI